MAQKEIKAYLSIRLKLEKEMQALPWTLDSKGSWERKWEILEKFNAMWDKLTQADRNKIIGASLYENAKTTMNEAVALKRSYKQQIDKGVYGRDLIQPLLADGNPNPDFVEHYGVANYTPEQKEYIRDKMGRDPNREKDWRSEKK